MTWIDLFAIPVGVLFMVVMGYWSYRLGEEPTTGEFDCRMPYLGTIGQSDIALDTDTREDTRVTLERAWRR